MTLLEKLYAYDPSGDPPIQRRAVRFAQFLAQLLGEFGKDACVVRANALAYASLLALVPLTAVLLSMFSVFAAFGDMKERLQEFLFTNLIPAKSGEIMTYMNTFAANTKQLGAIGAVAMLVTSVMLFQNIEKNINAVWKNKGKRRFVQKVMIFTAVLVWGTAFLGASFYVTGKVQKMMIYQEIMQIGILSRALWSLFPLVLSSLAFAFVMSVVPATKVRFRSAIIGGVTGAILFEIGKRLFARWAAGAVSYSVIYGSLALVPLFLIWLYVTWLIVLFAAEVTFVHQNFHALLKTRVFGELDAQKRLLLAVRIYLFIAWRFREGEPPAEVDDIADRFAVPIELAEEILDAFVESKLLAVVEEPSPGFIPARSPAALPIRELVCAVFRTRDAKFALPESESTDRLAEAIVDQFENAGYEAIGAADVESLLAGSGPLARA